MVTRTRSGSFGSEGVHVTNRGAEIDSAESELIREMCDELIQEGVSSLHFYTLNDPKLTQKVCEALGRKSCPTNIKKVA